MSVLPKLRTRYGENIGIELFVAPPLLEENNHTFLSDDVAAGASSLSVDNGNKFSANDYVVVGQIGGEKTEIVQVSTAAAGSLTTGALAFAHSRGERITFIPYNQIVPERSTDSGANYSALTAVGIRPDSTETYIQRSSDSSTDYYRVRFYNSTTTKYSQYSDGIVGTGFAENSAGIVIRNALVTGGEEIDAIITKEFLYEALHEGRAELDQTQGVDRWSFRTAFDYDAGDVITGHDRITLPSDLRDPSTAKHVLAVSIGKDRRPVRYVDKVAFNRWYLGVSRSTLNGAITTASTSLVLTSSGDFDESGSVTIAGAAVSDVVDEVTYTSNTESTNTLGGASSITSNHADGSIVWQGASFGYPLEYTVDDGVLRFSQPFDDTMAGENVWLDYYKTLTKIDSDSDTFDEPSYMMYVPYLRWRMKHRRNTELKAEDDSDYKEWVAKRDAIVATEWTGQDMRFAVDVPC